MIQPQLAKLNRYGLLTINSQPPVDGASSSHPVFGWGGKGGKVYQKAYFECFVSPDKADRLTQMITQHPSINMYAINNDGQDLRAGVEEGGVTGERKAICLNDYHGEFLALTRAYVLFSIDMGCFS